MPKPSPTRVAEAPDGTRDRLLAAAAAEFAARGFAGANVDRIAAAAGVNKAMIYYHFDGKADLYSLVLRDMFEAVRARVRAVADSDTTPAGKIRRFVEAIAEAAAARPHFPPIWLREIAEGAAHIDDETLEHARSVIGILAEIVQEGHRAGLFVRTNPALVHAGIVGPLMFYAASDGFRRRLAAAGVREVGSIDERAVVAHIQRITLGVLEGRLQ